MLSIVIPTRDRPDELALTLSSLGSLSLSLGSEIIIVDNASRRRWPDGGTLRNGATVRVIRSERNLAAAGRNLGVEAAKNEWVVMLDDDSSLIDLGVLDAVDQPGDDVAAIAADIRLPSGAREAGGLPEVPVGCGVAYRRSVFLEAGGYDESFEYYAEEYDLAARLISGGWRILHDQRFCVLHRKVVQGRDFNEIVRRLVRNNGWVRQRYAPESVRTAEVDIEIERYRAIAKKESAIEGYQRGLTELRATLETQPRREMSPELYARFTGEAAARDHLSSQLADSKSSPIAIVEPGKGVEIIERVIRELGVSLVAAPVDAKTLVVGTLSPGPMLDALDHATIMGKKLLGAWSLKFDK